MLKYLRQFGIFFCSAVLIFLYPLTAPAGTAVSAPEQGRQPLRVGYINYDGFIVQENGGYIDGYGVAFLDKISEYTGWRDDRSRMLRPEQAGQEGPVRVYGVSNRA